MKNSYYSVKETIIHILMVLSLVLLYGCGDDSKPESALNTQSLTVDTDTFEAQIDDLKAKCKSDASAFFKSQYESCLIPRSGLTTPEEAVCASIRDRSIVSVTTDFDNYAIQAMTFTQSCGGYTYLPSDCANSAISTLSSHLYTCSRPVVGIH